MRPIAQSFRSSVLLVLLITTLLSDDVATQDNSTAKRAAELEAQARAASLEWSEESVRRSLELYIEAAELWRKAGDAAKSAAALRDASQQKLMLGDTEGAFTLLSDIAQTGENAADIPGRVQTLSLLSRVSLQLGRFRESEIYYRQALALADMTDDPMARGEAFFSASVYLYERQAVDQIIKLNQQALEQFRLAGDKAREAEVLVEQSYAYLLRRDPLASVQIARQALDIAEQTDDRRGRVDALIAIGNANITMGESRPAYEAYKKADGLILDSPDYSKRARIANGLGAIFEKYGDWSQSLHYRERALQHFKTEKNRPGQLHTLFSAGSLCGLLGDYDGAMKYLSEGEALARELRDNLVLALVQVEQGRIGFSRGRLDSSREYYGRALRTFGRLKDRLYLALVHNHLGELEERAGRLNVALRHYNTALRYNRDVKSRFAEADSLYHVARLSEAQNRLGDALKHIEESLRISETLRGSVTNSRLRTSYFSEVHDRFRFYIHLLMRLHQQDSSAGYNARALQAAERARARTLLDTLRIVGMDFSVGADAALVEREKRVRVELTLKSDEMTGLINSSEFQNGEIERLRDEIDTLSAEYEDIKASLREHSTQYRTLAEPGGFDLTRFQSSILDDSTLLVEFSFGKDQSYMWLVDDKEVSSYVLPPQSIIQKRVGEVLELLSNREIRDGEELENYQQRLGAAEKEFWHKGQELSNLLFSQAAEKLGDKRLVVVADGGLHYLPLAALPKPQRGEGEALQTPFALDHEIVYQPSANTLLLLENKTAEDSSAKTLLVFADPIFSPNDARLTRGISGGVGAPGVQSSFAMRERQAKGRVFLRLPATHLEAESISSYLGADQSTILTGATASRENLLHTDFRDYKIVHFATHGLYDEENPELSGIILSQFDEQGNPRNGYLRLNDIYQLSMPVDLVVLSACSSGRGEEVRGEGVVGLTRGFLQSSSKSVLSSLWKVDDAATAEIMKYFYEALLTEKNTPAKALRQAQLKMRRNSTWQFPFYWAAFTLHGDFRHSISPADKPLNITYLGRGVFLLLLLGFIYYLRKRAMFANITRHFRG